MDDRGFGRATERLIVGYKALYFFIQAYQDRLYTAASVAVMPDSPPGGRMANAFKPARHGTNPVRAFLDERVPEYAAWFAVWREQRNQVKNGVSFSTGGPAPEIGLDTIGIRFNEFTEEGGISVDLSHAVQLSDVTHGLRVSARLAVEIKRVLVGR